jgi:hypothetical protein
MLSTPYSLKLLSLLWTEVCRNTRNCGKAWSSQKGHSVPQRVSGVQKSPHFLMKLNTPSQCNSRLRLKQTSRVEHTFWKSVNSKLNKKNHTHTHTHTQSKCWYTVCYLLSKVLNFHLLNYNVEQTKRHWTPGHTGVLHQFPQCKWEDFFQGLLCIPKGWIYLMSVKSWVFQEFL